MLIFAHRGASKAAPENSVKAFNLAFEQNADGIEFDTDQHDSGIVVFHDRTLARRARETGYLLDTQWETLRNMDIGEGERIPTLAEALNCVADNKWCNIEIKHLKDVDGWVREVKIAVRQSDIDTEKLLISSFNHHWLQAIASRWSEVKIGALSASYELDCTASARALHAYSVNIALDAVDKEFVQTAQQEGFDVFVYTVDEPRDMLMLKVAGIFTNVPDTARKVLL